jgi:chromosome segregation ATPase
MDAQTRLQDWIALLDERLSSLEVSLKALQKRVENAERRQEELEEALDQLRDEIEDCVADTTYLFDSIEEVQEDLDEMKK